MRAYISEVGKYNLLLSVFGAKMLALCYESLCSFNQPGFEFSVKTFLGWLLNVLHYPFRTSTSLKSLPEINISSSLELFDICCQTTICWTSAENDFWCYREKEQDEFLVPTLELLRKHACKLDPIRVLEIIPSHWSLGILDSFLKSTLRKSIHKVRCERSIDINQARSDIPVAMSSLEQQCSVGWYYVFWAGNPQCIHDVMIAYPHTAWLVSAWPISFSGSL